MTDDQISDDVEMVVLFSSQNLDAEVEAMAIHGILEANNIPSLMVGPSTLPVVEFQVQVPADRAVEAKRLLEEARATGPQAAEEAERLTEGIITPED